MLKRYNSMRMGRIAITLIMLLSLATLGWAKRYELPADHEVLVQINTPRDAHLETEQFSVLVWNMQKGIRNSWKRDYHHLSQGMDILLLQEVLLDEKMGETLDRHDDYSYHLAASFKDTWDDHVVTGVATASMARPINSSYLRSSHREPVIATPKMAMLTEYKLADTGETLLTANIHAINFVSKEKHRHMLAELEQMLTTHEGPMILAGDFNTWSSEKTRSLQKMIQRLGLNEVEFEHDHRTRVFGNAIDWVFARGLSVNDARVHHGVEGSDHKPMEVVFSFTG